MMGALTDLFFSDEFNEFVASVLQEVLAAERNAYLTFNRFNVRIDRKMSTVTIEDELDPTAEESMSIDTFKRRLLETA